MLTVPTGEFLGILADVLPLSAAAKDDRHYGVLLEWDGDALHAHATDALSGAISTWHPDDKTDFSDDPQYAHLTFGATDVSDEARWRVFVNLDDAKEIAKTFKLAYKFRMIPLNIKVSLSRSRLIIERPAEMGKTHHEMIVAPTGAETSFPDLRKQVQQLWSEVATATELTIWGHRLAAFEHASRRGPLTITPTGSYADGPAIVTCTDRFAGAVAVQRHPDRPAEGNTSTAPLEQV